MTFLLHWLAVHTGTVNEGGPYYGFWSGFGSDLGEGTLVVGLIGMYRSRTCGSPGCFRIGKHPTADGLHHLCHKHHPDLPAKHRTLEEIIAAHVEAKAK